MIIRIHLTVLLLCTLSLRSLAQGIADCVYVQSESITSDEQAAAQLVGKIRELVGLTSLKIEVRNCENVNNVEAVSYRDRFYIFINPDYMRRSKVMNAAWSAGVKLPSVVTDPQLAVILAHELGHILDGHFNLGKEPGEAEELKADEFAGITMARMNFGLEKGFQVYRTLPAHGGDSHPPLSERLAAFERGYRSVGQVQPSPPAPDPTLPAPIRQLIADMVPIEGGTFWMGCTPGDGECEEDEKPRHQVTVKDFKLGKYEVTQAQWQAVMGENPSYFKTCGSDCPVESVSWDEVKLFIRKLNEMTGMSFRLPSEAEWEYAARGGNGSDNTKYSGSGSLDLVGWYRDNSGRTTHSVKSKVGNELGLYHMSGNVWEWCEDDWHWHSDYSGAPTDGRAWIGSPRGSSRVLRGGNWYYGARHCCVSNRNSSSADSRASNNGFRVVLQ